MRTGRHAIVVLATCCALLVAGQPANAEAVPASACTISGTDGPDLLRGTEGPDVICGRRGGDRIYGEGGNDRIYGQAGSDRLHGGQGLDYLYGEGGHDVLFLGPGADRYAFSLGEDTCVISGFHRAIRRPCAGRVDPSFCCSVIRTHPGSAGAGEVSGCRRDCEPPPDEAPPKVRWVGFWPRSVDLSEGGAAVQLGIGAYDVGNGAPTSGVTSIRVAISGPDGPWRRLEPSCDETGETLAWVSIPASATPGDYRISSLEVEDAAGNVTTLSGTQLSERGYFSELVAYDGPDTEAPRLTRFAATPTTVDTATSPAIVQFEVEGADDQSGIAAAGVSIVPPGWQHVDGFPDTWLPPSDLHSGSLRHGTWLGSMNLGHFAQPGTYAIEVHLADHAGNSTTYGAPELKELGYPAEVIQTADGDTEPPLVQDVAVSPSVVHAAAGQTRFTIFLHVSDDLSGFSEGPWEYPHSSLEELSIGLEGPGPAWGWGYSWPQLVSGTGLDGIWKVEAGLDPLAPAGTYRVRAVNATDRAGNREIIQGPALEATGWDLSLDNEP